MTDAKPECLAIVGVGLIGGSIALAARRSGEFGPILGIGRDSATLEAARASGMIDEGLTDLTVAARRADVVVVCTPVDRIAEQTLRAASHCKPGTLLTDAGSTKAVIVAAVERSLSPHVQFIGSHPLAGSEKRGPEHARAELFDDRLTILTPTDRTHPAAEARAGLFWKALGSRVQRMSPARHDEALAVTSHLPHLVAAALAGVLPPELRELTATGFRDTTRIAAGDPSLWTAIFTQNRMPMLEAIGLMQDRLVHFKRALMERDSAMIERLLTAAKRVRDDLGS